MRKLLCLLLAAVSLCMVTACNENASVESSSSDVQTIKETDTYLIKNGVSPYQIVIPNEAGSEMKTAANELQYFFSLSTGVKLPIIDDENVSNLQGKYLSIGNTKIAQATSLELTEQVLGPDGYHLYTYGDAMVMAGATDTASLFSVYGYLDYQFDLEIYTNTVFTYEETKTEKLVDIAVTDLPDIECRYGSTYLTCGQNLTTETKGRYRVRAAGALSGIFGHAHFMMIHPGTYQTAHPEWFNKTTTQLAWENEEMWPYFVESVKKWIDDNKDARYFVIGFEDNSQAAHAPYDTISETKVGQYDVNVKLDEETGEYVAVEEDTGLYATSGPLKYNYLKQKYGGYDVAVQILFKNYVVRELNAYTAEKYPDREYTYGMYAYLHCVEPPVVWDEANGKYVPIAEEMVLEENLSVSMAYLDASVNSSHSYFDKEWNATTARQLEGWRVLSDKMIMWGYSTNFGDFLAPFNSWAAYKENYMNYVEYNVVNMYEQGCLQTVPNYMELRQYLTSKLAWDTTLDTEELIVNFMKAYYKEAFEPMYKYFNLMRNRLYELEYAGVYNTVAGDYSRENCSKLFNDSCFPKGFIDNCERIIEEALAIADATGDEALRFAIEKDRMPLRYLALSIHKSAYGGSEYALMVKDFETLANKMGFIYWNEFQHPVTQLINNWLSA